ncbi:Tad domain-containing protein [Brevibacillus dissolubilis]|uniref:Tad domain-containing protein n=1 Tax=Brevibacillus dissolubilis TaxID=1844116 RepID=UPI00159B8921|nr:Tad domain-containing protein [Brevibacillus dissolubilis]
MKKDIRGQVAVLFAAALVVFVLILAFVVDYGRMTYYHAKVQNATDLAVLAGAQFLPEDKNLSPPLARTLRANNMAYSVASANLNDPRYVCHTNYSGKTMRLYCGGTVPILFPMIFGTGRVVDASATAEWGAVSQAEKMVPISIDYTAVPNSKMDDKTYRLKIDLKSPSSGKLFLIHPNADGGMGPDEAVNWIEHDYTGVTPKVGEIRSTAPEIDLDSVMTALENRIQQGSGKAKIITPVVQYSMDSTGIGTAVIRGYTQLEVTGISRKTTGGSNQIELEGVFKRLIVYDWPTTAAGEYYGISSIYLVK